LLTRNPRAAAWAAFLFAAARLSRAWTAQYWTKAQPRSTKYKGIPHRHGSSRPSANLLSQNTKL